MNVERSTPGLPEGFGQSLSLLIARREQADASHVDERTVAVQEWRHAASEVVPPRVEAPAGPALDVKRLSHGVAEVAKRVDAPPAEIHDEFYVLRHLPPRFSGLIVQTLSG